LITDDNGTFEYAGMFDKATPRISTAGKTGTVPMRFVRGHTVYSKQAKAFQSNDATRIYNVVEVEMQRMMQSILEGLENALAGKPATSADETTVWGLPMYLVKSDTKGFNGKNPTGFASGVAGIDSDTYTRYANYTDTFSEYSRSDFGVTMQEAILSTKFYSPVQVNMPEAIPQTTSRRWFTTKQNILDLTSYQEDRNTNSGPDVVVNQHGAVTLNNNPVMHAAVLDTDGDNPFYGVDGNSMKMISLSGFDQLRPSQAYKADGYYSDTVMSDTLLSCNLACNDRRRQIVIKKV
jgi:hypothetical protein